MLEEEEQRYIGKRVKACTNVSYGSYGIIRLGAKGTINDFGRTSGDPIVKWDNGKETVIPWDYIKFFNSNL